jgi:hypothetical protein
MLFVAALTLFIFFLSWLTFALVAYIFIYGSLVFSYLFIWDDQTRKQICPHGLWATIFLDK